MTSTTPREGPALHYAVVLASLAVSLLAIGVTIGVLTSSVPRPSVPTAFVTLDPAVPNGPTLARQVAAVPDPAVTLGTYANPVSTLDFPDPDVVDVGGTYVAFGTGNVNDVGIDVSEMSTSNLGTWPDDSDDLADALPHVGSWATTSTYERVWAPSVIQANGRWLLFYAAVDTDHRVRCIGVATSRNVFGPYQDTNPEPLMCQSQLGGDIDPDAFRGTNGQLYLAWKSNDGSSAQLASLWDAPVTPTPSGVAFAGSPVRLLTQDQGWETTIENPAMVPMGSEYLLLFSGGPWETAEYATGYSVCQSPLGPCHEPLEHPILFSTSTVAGPGGASVFTDGNGDRWVAYAAWSPPNVGYSAGGSRSLRIDPLCFDTGTPVIPGPSIGAENLTPSCAAISDES